MKTRNLLPLFDAAYLGINSGNFANDAKAIRYFVDEIGMNAAICLSFAKNMGLYCEEPFLPSVKKKSADFRES
jgi:aspartate aminotransferase, cytoplasmic